jgi:hypothetical protein
VRRLVDLVPAVIGFLSSVYLVQFVLLPTFTRLGESTSFLALVALWMVPCTKKLEKPGLMKKPKSKAMAMAKAKAKAKAKAIKAKNSDRFLDLLEECGGVGEGCELHKLLSQ